jgi:hypothetical protein
MVKTDDRGGYETDLPFGVWTMTLLAISDDTTGLARPRHFQLSEAGSLVFDIHLRPGPCGSVWGTPKQRAAICWGEESFQVPSADGVTFEIDLFGLYNKFGSTPCDTGQAKSSHREFATYNLLSIEADHVGYYPSEKILEASGDVVMQDESGEHKADSVRLRLQDGQVSALTHDH